MKLTICIPSFNRTKAAIACTTRLLKITNKFNVKILVIDNGSDSKYEEEFSKIDFLKQAMIEGLLSINRNQFNIGMGANFMRCFELADGDWLWMVADDDSIRSDALETIFYALNNHSHDYGFMLFGGESSLNSKPTTKLESIEEFIDYNHISEINFNQFIFLSNGLYKLSHFKPLLSFGYQNINTYIPHFMMQVAYLQQGKPCICIHKTIVDYIVPTTGYSYSMVAGLGVGAPKHALIKTDKIHYKKFLKLFFPHSDFKVIIDLYYICKRDSTPYVCQHLAKKYIFYAKDARPLTKIIFLYCFSYLLLFPNLFERMIGIFTFLSPKIGKHIAEIKTRYRKST